MQIRRAEQRDLTALLEIYNAEVLHGVATLDLTPRTEAEWQIWLDSHNKGNHPLFVAELDGHVAGYASFSPFRDKEAYASTVELSIYVAQNDRKKGVATALMRHMLAEAARDPRTHSIVSVITAGNEASQQLHKVFGFSYCGKIPAVGKKFDRFLDIAYYWKLARQPESGEES